jgi:hypothetical protein
VRAAPQLEVKLGLPLALCGAPLPLSDEAFAHGLLQMDANDVWLIVAGRQRLDMAARVIGATNLGGSRGR